MEVNIVWYTMLCLLAGAGTLALIQRGWKEICKYD